MVLRLSVLNAGRRCLILVLISLWGKTSSFISKMIDCCSRNVAWDLFPAAVGRGREGRAPDRQKRLLCEGE